MTQKDYENKDKSCEGCGITLENPSYWKRFCDECRTEKKKIGAQIRYLKTLKKTMVRKKKLVNALNTGQRFTIKELAKMTGYKPETVSSIVNQLGIKLTRRVCVYLEKPLNEGRNE